jgi:Zn-finger protein
LINKTVMMTPQWFEEDNGLYCYETECPGMWFERSKEADSIYHLFGTQFENFMDCTLIKGTGEDKATYKKIIQDTAEAEAKAWGGGICT